MARKDKLTNHILSPILKDFDDLSNSFDYELSKQTRRHNLDERNLSNVNQSPNQSRLLIGANECNQMDLRKVETTKPFWYKPNLTRVKSVYHLKDKIVGNFIVRKNALSLKLHSGEVSHNKINKIRINSLITPIPHSYRRLYYLTDADEDEDGEQFAWKLERCIYHFQNAVSLVAHHVGVHRNCNCPLLVLPHSDIISCNLLKLNKKESRIEEISKEIGRYTGNYDNIENNSKKENHFSFKNYPKSSNNTKITITNSKSSNNNNGALTNSKSLENNITITNSKSSNNNNITILNNKSSKNNNVTITTSKGTKRVNKQINDSVFEYAKCSNLGNAKTRADLNQNKEPLLKNTKSNFEKTWYDEAQKGSFNKDDSNSTSLENMRSYENSVFYSSRESVNEKLDKFETLENSFSNLGVPQQPLSIVNKLFYLGNVNIVEIYDKSNTSLDKTSQDMNHSKGVTNINKEIFANESTKFGQQNNRQLIGAVDTKGYKINRGWNSTIQEECNIAATKRPNLTGDRLNVVVGQPDKNDCSPIYAQPFDTHHGSIQSARDSLRKKKKVPTATLR